jgi:AAA+ superfamily predicted ATPase
VNGQYVLLEEDFFIPQEPGAVRAILNGLMNAENIKLHIDRLIQDVSIIKKKNGDPKKLLKNYSFEGSPGTGKTTVARAFGQVFHDLGLLSRPDVVECKAMELIGQFVGHSADNMRCVTQYRTALVHCTR